jgi:hypothetical protein
MLNYQVSVRTKQWNRQTKIHMLREWPARTCSRQCDTQSSTRSAWRKKIKKRREQTKPNGLYKDQCEVRRSEVDNGHHDVLQSNEKFPSLKEQALFYDDIRDDDPIDYHEVDIGQKSPEKLADAIEGSITSAEQEGMPRDGVQSLRQLVTECKDVFRLNVGADLLRM